MKHKYEEYDYEDELRGDYDQEDNDYHLYQNFRAGLLAGIIIVLSVLLLFRLFG